MSKKKACSDTNRLSHEEHAALLNAEHVAALSQCRLAHAHTRKHLQAVIAELAALRVKESTRDATEAVAMDVKTSITDADAAMKALSDLTQAIRKTHNLSEQHAIDSMTGAIISPGAQQ